MSLGKVGAIVMGIIYVAVLYVAVSHSGTSDIINAAGSNFTSALRAAMGG